MRRTWTYAVSVVAIPVVLVGMVLFVASGTDAYMVGIGGAKPGEPIFLDTLASPLRESLLYMLLGTILIGGGLWARALARRWRRAS